MLLELACNLPLHHHGGYKQKSKFGSYKHSRKEKKGEEERKSKEKRRRRTREKEKLN